MTGRQPYTYVLLRYRHDPLAGEFANVGVLLHAPEAGILDARLRKSTGSRLPQMFPSMHRQAFNEALRSIGRTVRNLAAGDGGDLLSRLGDAATFARRALPTDDSSFVWGPLGSGLTADPARTLDNLFARFVTQYDKQGAKDGRDDADVWRPVQDMLLAREIADRLQPKAIRSRVGEVEFEHAWKNGAWHVYQPLSFDLASDDHIRDKAARWAGRLLSLRDAHEPFQPHFIVGAPQNTELSDAYQKALEVLRLPQPDAEIVDETDVGDLVDRIEAELRTHDEALAG